MHEHSRRAREPGEDGPARRLRHGIHEPSGIRAWSPKYRRWLKGLKFDSSALQVAFDEYRLNIEEIEGRIERHPAAMTTSIKKRQEGLPASIQAIAWKAQLRLCKKYRRLIGKGKSAQVAVTAVARPVDGRISHR